MNERHTTNRWPDDERLADLMSQHATEGLSDAERTEMQQLLRSDASIDPRAAELAAAAADVAFISEAGVEAMPADLARKLVDLGEREMADAEANAADSRPMPTPQAHARTQPELSFTQRTGTIAWLAAAAALLIAAMLYVAQTRPAPSPAEQRAALLVKAPDVIKVDWTVKSDDYADVTGDVVWSDAQQAGFMRLTNLPINDASEKQYQLWIVDPDRDARPVDGGVFNITAADLNEAGEAIVPIDAKLRIDQPAAFAITVEKPGGVVKSAGPLHVVAPVPAKPSSDAPPG